MITVDIKGVHATVTDGIWDVPDYPELAKTLNAPYMQPPEDGAYAPNRDWKCAEHVVRLWGATIVTADPVESQPGVIY